MKKKHSSRQYKTVTEMDMALETADISEDILERGVVIRTPIKQINLALPQYVVAQIDQIADKMGVSRQPLLKIWIHERLKQELHT